MKKKFIVTMLLILCFAPLSVMAQHSAVDKGSFELGVGHIFDIWLFSSDNYESYTEICIGATPTLTAGYFIIDGFMIGTTVYYNNYKSESMTDSDTYFSIQPEVKFYFPVSEQFLINAKGFLGMRSSTYDGDSSKYTRMRFGAGCAGTYMLLPTLGASFGADFTLYQDRKVDGTTIGSTSYKIINIFVGLTAYF